MTHSPYLAFIDGSLDYDCAACGSHCCRGYGFGGMEEREMATLLDEHPELLCWVRARRHGYLSLGSPAGDCLYLEGDGRCRIQAASGREAKPGVCRLFPFNRLTRVGAQIVVMPHFLCPLKLVVPARSGAVAGSHAAVLEELEATGMGAGAGQPAVIHDGEDATATVLRERAFRNACGEALGRARMPDTLASVSDDAAGLKTFGRRAATLLGAAPLAVSRPRDVFDDLLLALAPARRINLLSLSPEGRLRALLLADTLVRGSFAGATRPPSARGVAGFLDAVEPLLAVLSLDDEVFTPLRDWTPTGPRPSLESAQHKAAFGAMILLTRKGRGTLDAVEEAVAPLSRPLERVLFVRALAELLRPPAPASATADAADERPGRAPA